MSNYNKNWFVKFAVTALTAAPPRVEKIQINFCLFKHQIICKKILAVLVSLQRWNFVNGVLQAQLFSF